MNYIFGYGSLLSNYSRRHYSGITCEAITATVSGWYRAWCAVYQDEGATYAGALRDTTQQLDGILIASDIDAGLSHRERGYQFSRLAIDELQLHDSAHTLTAKDQVWICETILPGNGLIQLNNALTPLPQSYVDTCLIGCMESHGATGAARFVQQTKGWNCTWVNDRQRGPIYPRASPVSSDQASLIDSVLAQQGVLQFRQPA